MKSLLLLGSTGSIGRQTLDLVRGAPGEFRVLGLAAASSWERLLEQAREFRPALVALASEEAAASLRSALPAGIGVRSGPGAAEELALELDYDLAVHGITGAAGVRPTQRILERGRALGLANKESLVVAGKPLMELARATGARLLPIDSEHSAIFQCLRDEPLGRVRRILLTASGGAFRDLPLAELEHVTPERAQQHPNWDMGPRITVGSATLMNKALEVIETHHLFGLEPERIEVVLHRQSIVHSLVEFVDGSVLAQMGPPDMRGPIQFALHWPERRPSELVGFDLRWFRELSFAAVDRERFPSLELGYQCVREGGDAGATLNAADEEAVQAFRDGRIGFQDIARINRSVLEKRPRLSGSTVASVDALLEADLRARALAQHEIARLARPPLPT
ncbi:MAG: 1-deoxy-D-xylulose-5-phosphate reductoisomerase [Planctomycetes bacterium]|nr:1-deoxy-D-xylulose-5-phosphate reductoisomerase [Planctomycetota bacterium]